MTRIAVAALAVLCFTSAAHGADSYTKRFAVEMDDPSSESGPGFEGDFYQALMGAFFGYGAEWGPGDNPTGYESPDPDEIIIEPGDLLPGPTDNGNCMDYAWEGRCG